MHSDCYLLKPAVHVQSTSGYMPRAPPNDPERHGNIWQQHERLQADYQQLLDQNNKLTSERTHYQNVRLFQPASYLVQCSMHSACGLSPAISAHVCPAMCNVPWRYILKSQTSNFHLAGQATDRECSWRAVARKSLTSPAGERQAACTSHHNHCANRARWG